MIMIQVWIRCSVPDCGAADTVMAPLIERTHNDLTIHREFLRLPDGWLLGPHFHNAIVCPKHGELSGSWEIRDDHEQRAPL